MIIIEGADCTGKTTACETMARIMAERLGAPVSNCYAHMSKPPHDFDHVRGYVRAVRPVVQDRFHLGAIAYGAIIGGGSYPTAARMRTVQRYLRWQGCLVIIMHASRETLRRRLLQSVKAEMYSHDDILDANDAFRALIGSTNRGEPYCDFDFDTTDAFPTEEVLRSWVDRWSQRWRGVS